MNNQELVTALILATTTVATGNSIAQIQPILTHKQLAFTESANTNRKCVAAERRLAKIKARMRAGYRGAQANRLHDQELRARKARRKYCRD